MYNMYIIELIQNNMLVVHKVYVINVHLVYNLHNIHSKYKLICYSMTNLMMYKLIFYYSAPNYKKRHKP